jgi:putative hydrolase of the HAD superfamily
MPPEPRAILFDLDDTLYPLRRFVRSGFHAVAIELSRHAPIRPADAFEMFIRARRGGSRGRELQTCVAQLGVSVALVPVLLDVYRSHAPRLTLPKATRATLARLRPDWRLGIITNGIPAVQAAKVSALGLTALVDAVVFANAFGSGRGKPDPEPFLEAARRLGVAPDRTVVVGDDEQADVMGARGVGMPAIRVVRPGRERGVVEVLSEPALAVRSLLDVPLLAEWLLTQRRSPHAA